MAYTNSPLAKEKFLGKNYYNHRNGLLGIVPHCVVGKLSGMDAWSYFRGTNNASCNYYIEDNGTIWCFVPEKYSAWTTSSYKVDTNHITVEIASETKHPYRISDAAYNALIKLTIDVYKRNGLTKCIWDKTTKYDFIPGGVPMHRNYKNKACPGDYIVEKYSRGDFCKKVNEGLGGKKMADNVPKQTPGNAVNDAGIKYKAHVQSIGWCSEVHDGQTAGTTGFAKRLEAIKITVPEGMSLKVKGHIQQIGWRHYEGNDVTVGTEGKALRLEAIEIEAIGVPAGKKFMYQVHVQGIGWMDWTESGYPTGTMNQSKRIEAVRIKMV